MSKYKTQGKYILDENGNPVEETDLIKWAMWFENANNTRIVTRTEIGNTVVSTVFLGLDHSFGEGAPILYETMVFIDGESNGEQWRYATKEEALEGHAEVILNYIK
jgi:hypothetical protein